MAKKVTKKVKVKPVVQYKSLCYRCQHRADFLELGMGFRYECQQPTKAVCSCYAYMPIRPLLIQRNKGDNRPMFGPTIISARSHSVQEAECALKCKQIGRDKGVLYWEPK